MKSKINIEEIIQHLKAMHPNPVCELVYNSPFELLVAVILSAQCTDKRVNQVTSVLFKQFNTPQQFAQLTTEQLKPYIFTCGFFNNKAKNIIATAKTLVDEFNGVVPNTVDELIKLQGVGKKTANVVFAVGFGGDAIAVDTHVLRVSNRLGLANSKNPLEVEKQLNAVIPKEEWSVFHHLLIHQGRYICKAQKPKCEECNLNDVCNYFATVNKDNNKGKKDNKNAKN
ncbi:MAG: endonuclease III [Clostridia bacterium]